MLASAKLIASGLATISIAGAGKFQRHYKN